MQLYNKLSYNIITNMEEPRYSKCGKWLLLAFCLASLGLVAVASMMLTQLNNQGIAEVNQVIDLSVNETCQLHRIAISVTGFIAESSLSVGSVANSADGSSLLVLVRLIPAWPGTSGNFRYQALLSTSTKRIEFGGEKTVIWTAAKNCAGAEN